jgi:hypothetical protein
MYTPTDCPHWDGCSAPVCPLNKTGSHLRDEPICFYALELVKPDAKERFKENQLIWLKDALEPNIDWFKSLARDIAKRLDKAALTKSRMSNSKFTLIAKG